ncbi:MAG TPA: sigma-70 family RNA polymerase sigma factor [Thermoanaerobaculia bacterium]
MDTTTRAALVSDLKAGEPTAFEALVRMQMPALLRAARRFLRSEEDARDAVQDTFVSAFKSIGTFQENSQLATWLHRILINSCLMKLRTQKRRPEEDIETYLPRFQDDGHQVEPSVPWAETAESILQRKQTRDLVRASIDSLPETYRVVLLLRDIEEMTTEETAKLLGITANAVKVRLHRARQALRTLLDPHMRSMR